METLTKKRGEEGFTLIELLIVIVILGILAAIVVFAVGTTGSNSAAAACKADAKSVEVALESYKAQNNNTYPSAPTAVVTSDPGWAALLGTANNGSPYLRAIPGTSHYQIWWNASGSVFIAGASPAAYPPTPSATNNFDLNQDPKTGACTVAS
jgi:prepilin-type N-terminal cleavage/methylation domain-containing protein